MVKCFVIAFFAVVAGYHVNAQTGGVIETRKVFGGYKYLLNGITLSKGQITEVIEKDPKAYPAMKKANDNDISATIFGAAGGILIGLPIGALIANRQPKWGLAGAGAALALLSLPFDHAYKKHLQVAVDEYNSNLTNLNNRKFKPSLSVAINNTGFGFLMKF